MLSEFKSTFDGLDDELGWLLFVLFTLLFPRLQEINVGVLLLLFCCFDVQGF